MEVLKARPTTTDIQSEFHKTGTIVLPAGSLFTNIELDELQVACQQVPEETIVLWRCWRAERSICRSVYGRQTRRVADSCKSSCLRWRS